MRLSLAGLAAIVALLWLALRSLLRAARVLAPLRARRAHGRGRARALRRRAHDSASRRHAAHRRRRLELRACSSIAATAARRGGAAHRSHRWLIANLCTVIGFGLLCFSGVPVLEALGTTVAPGALLALLYAALLDPPMRSIFRPARQDGIARTRMVWLPGAFHTPEDFVKRVSTPRSHGAASSSIWNSCIWSSITGRSARHRRLAREIVRRRARAGAGPSGSGAFRSAACSSWIMPPPRPESGMDCVCSRPILGNRLLISEIVAAPERCRLAAGAACGIRRRTSNMAFHSGATAPERRAPLPGLRPRGSFRAGASI